MQKYIDFVDSSKNGKAVSGASIKVYNNSDGTTAATIYSDNGTTVISNSTVTADADGMYWFYAPVGRYDLQISVAGTVVKTITDVQIVDQAGSVALTSLASQAANTVVGNSTGSAAVPTATQVNNAMVSASAGIALSKLASQAAYSLVGNNTSGSAVPTAVLNDDLLVKADGSTTYRDLSARFGEVFNAKDYGVVGDDATDDITALSAAVTAAAAATRGGVVVLPAATCKISSTLTVPTNVALWGQGVNASILHYTGSGVAVQGGNTAAAADTSTSLDGDFRDFCIQGPGRATVGAVGLVLTKCKNGKVRNVFIKQIETAFKVDGSDGFCASNEFYGLVTSNVKNGLLLTGTSTTRGCNNNHIFGGYLFGDSGPSAGGIGVSVVYGDTNSFFGTAVESFETGFSVTSLSSVGHRFFGPREESCTTAFSLAASTTRNIVIGSSSAITDSGTGNIIVSDSGGVQGDLTFDTAGQVILDDSITSAGTALPLCFDGDQNTGLFRPGADILGLCTGGAEYVRVTAGGFLKATNNNGTFVNPTGSHHELRSSSSDSSNGSALVTCTHATPYGHTVYFPTSPNNTTSWFFKGNDNSATRYLVYSNGTVRAANAAIPAGGTQGLGYTFSTTNNFGVFFGSGAPTLSAAKGSLYLRSDGSGTTDRMYVNTDGATTWTAVTTVA